MLWLSIFIASIALLIGSITDLKKREVHDYVSYGLMFCGLGFAIIYSIAYMDYTILAQSIMGFLIGLIIAYTMFYLGQWGGGDSKLMMGLGAVLGFNAFAIFGEKNYWIGIFMINLLLVGAVYGFLWSIYLAIKHRAVFMKKLKSFSAKKNILVWRRIFLSAVIVFIILIFTLVPLELRLVTLTLVAVIYITFYLWIYIRAVEQSCMVKELPISQLTEGDWIYKNVYVKNKLIASPKDLGISREQISLLKKYEKQKKIKTVTVKEGIPFIPAFFIAFLLTIVIYYLLSLGLIHILWYAL